MARVKITAIIPTKNEEDTIGLTIQEIPKDLIDEIIVVDAHSSDETVKRAEAAGAKVVFEDAPGYGNAVKTGIRSASGELITLLDGDGAYNASSLHQHLEKLQAGNDVVFASRYLPESGSEDDTWITFIGNKLFTFLLNIMYGVKISDSLFLFILAKKEVFEKIQMKSIHFEYCMEFPIRVHRAGLKYTEIPSREKKRVAGSSKVNVLVDGWKILKVLLKG